MAKLDERNKAVEQYRSTSQLPHPNLHAESPTQNINQDTARPILILSELIQESDRAVRSRDRVGTIADRLLPIVIAALMVICVAFPNRAKQWKLYLLGNDAPAMHWAPANQSQTAH